MAQRGKDFAVGTLHPDPRTHIKVRWEQSPQSCLLTATHTLWIRVSTYTSCLHIRNNNGYNSFFKKKKKNRIREVIVWGYSVITASKGVGWRFETRMFWLQNPLSCHLCSCWPNAWTKTCEILRKWCMLSVVKNFENQTITFNWFLTLGIVEAGRLSTVRNTDL